jgi:23S rRNA pseudouridine955/2504/2580 synthase
MSKKPIFQVAANDSGQRLDNFLLKQRKHINKASWYKLIRKGQVRVNGKRAKAMTRLSAGDEIRIPPAIYFVEQTRPEVSAARQQELLKRVVFTDEDYLLLNKPAGLPVHAGSGHQLGVMEIMTSLAGHEQLQLAHRLDKDTSGCLLLARNRQALLLFQQAMKDQTVHKTYQALLVGELQQAVTVEQPLDTSHRVNGIRTVVVDPAGQTAVTHVTPLQTAHGLTWAECRIETGRTHQIRVHAQYLGHPVLGDRLYGQGEQLPGRELFLHASQLAFADRAFSIPVPAVFQAVFDRSIAD